MRWIWGLDLRFGFGLFAGWLGDMDLASYSEDHFVYD